jgi:hypothetical protein
VPMLAEVVDAVIGVDTHRDMHGAELASRSVRRWPLFR